MKKRCTKCNQYLPLSNFELRKDRIGDSYAWCFRCMKRTPLYVSVPVNDKYVQVLEKTSRTVGYPAEEDRGSGFIR